jgi:hypothetical protein
VLLYGYRVKTAADTDDAETRLVEKGIAEVHQTVRRETGGVLKGVVNFVTIGGVQRTANAGQDAAIAVIKRLVPGVTMRAVSGLHFSLPIGVTIAVAAVMVPLALEFPTAPCVIVSLLGVLVGWKVAYSPVASEANSIKEKAAEAGAGAANCMANACSIQ